MMWTIHFFLLDLGRDDDFQQHASCGKSQIPVSTASLLFEKIP